MPNQSNPISHRILFLNTLAFTVCFAAWMLNGVLVTYLVENKIFNWTTVEIGWLIAIPVLSGSLFRLPLGMLTDKYGGKWVYGLLLIFCSFPMYFLSYANSFMMFAILSFGFGMAGTSFAVGIASTSVWYPKKFQGTALGIFGIGNAGAALTTLFAPILLHYYSQNTTEGWRSLPKLYAFVLVFMAIIFLLFTKNKKPESGNNTFIKMMNPLKKIRVWRFGLYYFLVFGCFVSMAQWLVPYLVNVYSVSIVSAGIFASVFSFPSGIIRAAGGWLSDRFGARIVMIWVLGTSVFFSILLSFPKMEIFSRGKGITTLEAGTVTHVSDSLIIIGEKKYPLVKAKMEVDKTGTIFPAKNFHQEPIVSIGSKVTGKQLVAEGITHINFSANLWVFLALIMLIGISWGIGKAAVYKFIPDYFPEEVGVVGGLVGVIGGLGGFFCPILFAYLLEISGLWSSCWMLMVLISTLCLGWLIWVIQKKKE